MRDVVGFRPRALHLGLDLALADVDGQHLAAAGVGPAARQPGADVEALQHRDPALGPPALCRTRRACDCALMPPLRRARLGTREDADSRRSRYHIASFSDRLLPQREQVLATARWTFPSASPRRRRPPARPPPACARSSRRSSLPACRRRRTCGPARSASGRCGRRGRSPGSRPPGSTSGRNGRRGWRPSGSARCRPP